MVRLTRLRRHRGRLHAGVALNVRSQCLTPRETGCQQLAAVKSAIDPVAEGKQGDGSRQELSWRALV